MGVGLGLGRAAERAFRPRGRGSRGVSRDPGVLELDEPAGRQQERSRRLGLVDGGLLEGDEDFSPERIHLARQACAQVELSLRELPERVRSVFVLNRFEELTGNQIARRLGVSVSTVEKDMIRAILHLKERLK